MSTSLNLPNSNKMNEIVGSLLSNVGCSTDQKKMPAENSTRLSSEKPIHTDITHQANESPADRVNKLQADFTVNQVSSMEEVVNIEISDPIATTSKLPTGIIKPVVSMTNPLTMKFNLSALNELADGKKGAVKRKPDFPKQSLEKAKKSGSRKKKPKTELPPEENNERSINHTNNETVEPSSIPPTEKVKPKTKPKLANPKPSCTKTPNKPPNLKCMTCDKELSNEQNLMKHLLTHNNNHTCMICMKTFKSTHFLRHHMDKHNDGYNYSCEICHKKFKFRNNMVGHMRKHNMSKKFECEICHKKFIGRYNLKEHMKVHSDERPHECNFCDKAYKDRGALNKHLLTHQEKKVECNVCHRQFSSDKQVARHMQFHYSWPGDSFKRKTNIDGNGDKIKYQCDYCDKTFNHYSNMNAHVHKKHKEKKIKCPQCPKMFAYQYELREHMFIHLGGESSKFKCQVCDKSFQRSTTLKNHERTTHLGIKRFKCEICGKMFGTKFNMKVHVEKLHNGNSTGSNEQKIKRVRNNIPKNAPPVSQEAALVVQLPPPPNVQVDSHMIPQLAVTLPPPHQHPLLRSINNTSDIIRNAIAHIPELGYFPPLQPHPTRSYPFFGIPPTDFGVSQ